MQNLANAPGPLPLFAKASSGPRNGRSGLFQIGGSQEHFEASQQVCYFIPMPTTLIDIHSFWVILGSFFL
jgi:hypothetical protein